MMRNRVTNIPTIMGTATGTPMIMGMHTSTATPTNMDILMRTITVTAKLKKAGEAAGIARERRSSRFVPSRVFPGT
jgi:hypothetical protein